MTEYQNKDLLEYEGNPQIVEVSDSPDFSKSIIDKFQANSCLLNSYNASIDNGDLLVEGILLVISETKVISILDHCWNKSRSGAYYDVTHDYIWEKDKDFIKQREEEYDHDVTYRYYSCIEYPISECNLKYGSIRFRFSYNYLKDFFMEKLKNNK